MRTRLVYTRTIRRKAEPATYRDWEVSGPWTITAPLVLQSDNDAAEWLCQRDHQTGRQHALPLSYDIMEREFVE